MAGKKEYTHIILVSSDVVTDRRIQRLAKTLSEDGSSVLVLGHGNIKCPEVQASSFEVRRIQCWFRGGPGFYAELVWRMVWELRNIRYAILTCADLDTILAGRILKIFRKFRLVFDAHEWFTDVPELTHAPFKRGIWSMIGKGTIPAADACITVNESLAIRLGERYGRQFKVIRNVPELTGQIPTPPAGAIFRLAYLGVLNPGRGLRELIFAMTTLPAVELLILGDGILGAELKQQVKQHGMEDRILFAGKVIPPQIGDYLCNCHAGVNLLDRTSRSYYYSLANKFFDYLNFGLPVITMNFPEYDRINRAYKCAVLMDSLAEEEIKGAILKLAGDQAFYSIVREGVLEARSRFNWQLEKGKLIEIYHNLK